MSRVIRCAVATAPCLVGVLVFAAGPASATTAAPRPAPFVGVRSGFTTHPVVIGPCTPPSA
jgi:hypothetical protein